MRPCARADPLFVACVQANAAWWSQRGYNPKNGVAGVRAKQYASFRDHVILEALRVFRARSEGVPLESVPPVVYAMKPSADGRANGTAGQRGIVGFECCKIVLPAPCVGPYVEAPPVPADAQQVLLPDSKADAAGLEERRDNTRLTKERLDDERLGRTVRCECAALRAEDGERRCAHRLSPPRSSGKRRRRNDHSSANKTPIRM